MFVSNRKGAFTLAEMMLCLACIPWIIVVVGAMVRIMVNVPRYELSQLDILKLQLTQMLNRASNVTHSMGRIEYNHNGLRFTIELDGKRLVKRPGYEILGLDIVEFVGLEGGVKVCDKKQCVAIK